MKPLLLFLFLFCSITAFSQKQHEENYQKAYAALEKNEVDTAYKLFKALKNQINKSDTLYEYVIWYYIGAATELESKYRFNEDFAKSLELGLEALQLIKDNKVLFNEEFGQQEWWMTKNIIVSCFGSGNLVEAEKFKQVLYKGYKEKQLPKGIDGYFNFSYFKWKDKNVWGYEWYPQLPEDRFSKSFTKVVYYIYSTNPDGTDKEQVSRFHVLMFHQDKANAKFDYLLEKQVDTDKALISGSYYSFTYNEKIDYAKLKNDIVSILENDTQPDTRRTIPKKQN